MAVPTRIVSGDSTSWTLTADTSAEIVTYCFRDGDGDGINITGVNDGTDHTFTFTRADSAQLVPGWYDTSKVVENGTGGRTTTRNVSRLEVDPNPMVKPDESWNAKILGEIRAVYQARVKGNMTEAGSVAAGSYNRTPTDVLYEQLQIFERRVRREKLRGRRDRNRSAGNDILAKF